MKSITTTRSALYLGEGVLSSFLGLCALILPEFFTLGMEQLIGWLFVFLGLAQLFFLLNIRPNGELGSTLGIALIHLFVGGFLIKYPLEGMYSLTLLITSQFIAGGAVRLLLVYQIYPQKGWYWLLLGAFASWAMALITLMNWPLTAFWLLGFLSGLNFLSYGLSQITFGVIGMQQERMPKNR